MSIDAFPFDDQATTETQYSKLFRELKDNGIIGVYADTSFKVSVDSGGVRTLRVQSGSAVIRGFMAMSVDASDESVVLDAVASGAQRIDTVVLRLDPSNNDIFLTAVQGSSSAAPTLTQTDTGIYEFPLADVTLQSSNSMSVVDRRKYSGMDTGVWATETRPTSPKRGKIGYNVTTGQVEFYNGTAWDNILPDDTGWVNCTMSGGYVSGSYAQVRKIGNQVFLKCHITKTGGFTTDWVHAFSMSAAYRPTAAFFDTLTGSPSTVGNAVGIQVDDDGYAWVARVGGVTSGLYCNGNFSWLVN